MKVLVTGGAGFIGSHLVDLLMNCGYEVVVVDNLSQGRIENVLRWMGNPRFRFIKGDVADLETMSIAVESTDAVFHLAANPEVRVGDPSVHFRHNVYSTYIVLEAMRFKGVRKLVFTSSSTVYGEATIFPTPEDYSPLIPISTYGACKLASESLIIGYSQMFGIDSVILRLANVVGSRSRHGVVVDFIKKLRADPKRLEILGDGEQTKSYIHVSDCVDAILKSFENSCEGVQIYNVGSEDWINVKTIARIVVREMGLEDVEMTYRGGLEGRGWPGDVKKMLLDISRMKKIGWRPRFKSAEAISLAVKELMVEIDPRS